MLFLAMSSMLQDKLYIMKIFSCMLNIPRLVVIQNDITVLNSLKKNKAILKSLNWE